MSWRPTTRRPPAWTRPWRPRSSSSRARSPSHDDDLHDAHLHAQPRRHLLDDQLRPALPACPVFVLASSSVSRLGPQAAAPSTPGGTVVTLDAEDSHHALRVLRLRPGDECEVVVGPPFTRPRCCRPRQAEGASRCRCAWGSGWKGRKPARSYRQTVVLVQALPRPAALDWSIEKSTEAGASLILVVQTAGSPRPAGKDPRRGRALGRIAREAAKQSKQPAVPPWRSSVVCRGSRAASRAGPLFRRARPAGGADAVRPVFAPARRGPVRSSRRGRYRLPDRSRAVGGPRKRLDRGRAKELLQGGRGAGAGLGRGVLRTETAGPVAVAVARLALGDW